MNTELVVDVQTAFECSQVQAQCWIAAREMLAIKLFEHYWAMGQGHRPYPAGDWRSQPADLRNHWKLEAQKIMAEGTSA